MLQNILNKNKFQKYVHGLKRFLVNVTEEKNIPTIVFLAFLQVGDF